MKKILCVALGYPTEKNPYEASFFKEQIDFLSTEYQFDVVVYKERIKGLLFGRKTAYSVLEYTPGIKQYYPIASISIARRIVEAVGSMVRKKTNSKTAVGVYKTECYRNYRKRIIAGIIEDLELDYDLVYCITAQGIAYEALLFAEAKNKPFVISEHRPYPHPGWATIETEKEAFEKADCFFAIGKDKIRQVMLQNIKLKRIAYTGNLIDEETFTLSPIQHDYTTFLVVAAYSYFKNFDMFINTINRLSELTDKEFRVVIAGYGANKDYIEDIDTFERQVINSLFSDKVELIREVPRPDINELYNRTDAFVLTSIQEGQPMVALEAGCCGLPIFSTRCGGVEDYITDDIGRIVDITDSDKMASYLCDFVEKRITFDKNLIRKMIISKYGRDAFMRNVKSEFDRLLYK